VFPAERRLPGPFDGGKERFLVTNARGTSVQLYRDRVEKVGFREARLPARRGIALKAIRPV
jgi:hypothetical protein